LSAANAAKIGPRATRSTSARPRSRHYPGQGRRCIWLNEHIEADGEIVYRHACKLGLEGIVNKRKDSPYRSGRSPDWLKSKNPSCAAVKREAEEDWGKLRWR
jgi:hypothetical protein